MCQTERGAVGVFSVKKRLMGPFVSYMICDNVPLVWITAGLSSIASYAIGFRILIATFDIPQEYKETDIDILSGT